MTRRSMGEGTWDKARRRWRLRYTVDGEQKVATSATPGPAGQLEVQAEAAAAQLGIKVATPEAITLGAWLDEWLRDWVAGPGTMKDQSIRNYRNHVDKHLLPLHPVMLDALTPSLVQQTLNGLRARHQGGDRPMTQTGRQLVYDTLNAALKKAVDLEKAKRNVCVRVARPRRDTRPPLVWTDEQVDHFLDAIAADPDRLLGMMPVMMGMRKGEIIGTRWTDIGWGHEDGLPILHVNGQLGRGRNPTHVPRKSRSGLDRPYDAGIPDRVLEALVARRDAQTVKQISNPDQFVFTTTTGAPLTRSGFDRAWVRLVALSGLPYAKPHAGRHYFVNAQDGDLSEKAASVGHAPGDTTTIARTYRHVDQGKVANTVRERMNARFPGRRKVG